MIDYANLPRRNILCIDMKSFFASVEAGRLGLDPMKVCLAVIGDKKIPSSIVLAASPMMKKKYKIGTGSRLFDIPRNRPDIHIVEAHMSLYLDISVKIGRLLNEFVPIEAIHPYSSDEFWICTDGTEKLFGDRWEVARKIQKAIWERFRIPSCIGIGPNKFLAKVILDIEAKKKWIAECTYEDVRDKLWPQPVGKIWGIGSRMERNLGNLGIRTLGDLARTSPASLKKRYGVIGEQLYYHAWGVDLSPAIEAFDPDFQKGFGHNITLPRPYSGEEVTTVMLELAEEVCRRARAVKKSGRTVHFGMRYSQKAGGGGFSCSRSFDEPTNVTMDVYRLCKQLLQEQYDGSPIRAVHMSLNNLSPDDGVQLNFFEDQTKRRTLGYTMDQIRAKYGSTALLRAQSYTEAGVTIERSEKIGGHRS
ncbi:MAG TPA: UV damage repair protein UvrX [Bacillales bacterium]|nr:UV damage repair protein UvrX [Bacillales bacterium]